MSDMAKNLILWLVIAVVLMSVFQSFSPGESSSTQTDYTTFINQVNDGNVREVRINSDAREIRGVRTNGDTFVTYIPYFDEQLISDLIKQDVRVLGEPPES
ncbi:MAG: ATP-dependent metallopeptidase FtsH/Yme1/Tma family protein, partial [Alteromonas sp.]